MVWKGLAFLFAITTSLLFAWSGFSWALDGQGIHPTIAFPIAAVIHFLAYFWMAREADQARVAIEDYLEWLDEQEQNYQGWYDHPLMADISALKGSMIQLQRSKQYWQELANRHL